MAPKHEKKRLCWNCDANVSHHLAQCPFCGVDASQPPAQEERSIFKGYNSSLNSSKQEIPEPPFARRAAKDIPVQEEAPI